MLPKILPRIYYDDPATSGLLPPLLNFKGHVALQAWRVSNRLWHQGRTDLALLMPSLSSDCLQVSIHPSASIGTSVFLDHATGIIVGAFVVIGDIRIGDFARIGAGALVAHDVPGGCTAVGVPAGLTNCSEAVSG